MNTEFLQPSYFLASPTIYVFHVWDTLLDPNLGWKSKFGYVNLPFCKLGFLPFYGLYGLFTESQWFFLNWLQNIFDHFLAFLRSTHLKSLIFKSKLHVFAIIADIFSNLPKGISVTLVDIYLLGFFYASWKTIASEKIVVYVINNYPRVAWPAFSLTNFRDHSWIIWGANPYIFWLLVLLVSDLPW